MNTTTTATKINPSINIPFFNNVSSHDKVLFVKELSSMLRSGLHLTQALTVIESQAKHPKFKEVISNIKTEVEEGNYLSQALRKHPDVFDHIVVSVVESGEASGKLDTQLQDLSNEMERQQRFVAKLKGAMVYPMIIVVAMAAIGLLATLQIIPALKGVLEESGAELPWSTKIVIGISNFMLNEWYFLIIGIIVLLAVISFFLKSPSGQLLKDRLLIQEPSGLGKKVYMARFSRTLGMLLESGVPIVDAVKIVAGAINNEVYAGSLKEIARELERGVPMSVPIQKDPLFPDYVAQMIMVGEQTGQLDQTLLSLANYYEDQTDDVVKNFSSWLEPIIIIIIGIGVAFLVFSILMPVYDASLSIK